MRNHNDEYRDTADRKYSYGFDHIIRKYLLQRLQPFFVPHGNTLELGCYKGDMTEQILEHFASVTVVEAASELATLVQERFKDRVSVVTSSFETAQLSERFDNIFLVHTLEHLDDPVAVLAQVRKWITPEGRLFVAVPNATALSRQIAVRMGLVEHNAAVTPSEAVHGHRRTYTLDLLLSHVTSAGLHISDYGGVLVKPLANMQFDKAIALGVIDNDYLDACHDLARIYPQLSASLYAVCQG